MPIKEKCAGEPQSVFSYHDEKLPHNEKYNSQEYLENSAISKVGRKTDSESKKVEENWTKHGVRYVNINKVLNGKLGQKFYKIMSNCESKQ